MYTQNLNIKSNSVNASYKEFPNKNAIKQMQLLSACQKVDNTKANEKTKNSTGSGLDILMPVILAVLFSDCNIENEDIFTILISAILTL